MRLSTIASAAVLALSTAALAQVGQAPEDQKLGPNASLPDNVVAPSDGAGSVSASAPGAPSTALVNTVTGAGASQLPPK